MPRRRISNVGSTFPHFGDLGKSRRCDNGSGLGFRWLGLLLASAWLFPASSAEGANPLPNTSLWEDLADPGHRVFVTEIARARVLLTQIEKAESRLMAVMDPVQRRGLRLSKRGWLEARRNQALLALRKAIEASPKRGESYRLLGRLYYGWRRCAEAAPALLHARALQPSYRKDSQTAFELGICYSKMGAFRRAVGEYNRVERIEAVRAWRGRSTIRGTSHGNAAESLMALGRLDQAIGRFRKALRFGSDPLLYWGLAVALDRDGQLSHASEALRQALGPQSRRFYRGPRMRGVNNKMLGRRRRPRGVAVTPMPAHVSSAMSHLTRGGVFFVPAGDIHYYLGLGYEALGQRVRARQAFEKFIQMLPKSQWVYRARAHLVALAKRPPVKRHAGGRWVVPKPRSVTNSKIQMASDRRNYERSIRGEYHWMRNCYRRALRRSSRLAGTLRLDILVGLNGRASSAHIGAGSLRDRRLRACVLRRIRRRYFGRPVSRRPVRVSVTVEFKP